MPLVRIAGIVVLLLAAGCAGMDRAPRSEPPRSATTQEKAPTPQPVDPKPETVIVVAPAQTAPKQDVPVAVEPPPPPAPVAVSTSEDPAKPEAPAAKPPAKVSPPPTPKKESAVPPAPKPAPPPLDLPLLEKRLKETDAIGLFTKLTLKNQVDELLDQFREHYEGRAGTTLAQLRQPYDMLILKLLSLLQDHDPSLARAIAESREAIWGILSNPDKFKNP